MSDIADKVRKLLNKAERTDNENERNAYNAAAQRLIIEHAIDEASIKNSGSDRGEQIIEKWFNFKGGYSKAWISFAYRIAKALDLQGYSHVDEALVVAGYPSDLETLDALLASLVLQETHALATDWKKFKIERLGDIAYNSAISSHYTLQKNFKKSHIAAFSDTVATRIVALKRTIVAEKGTGTELVLASKKDRIQNWFEDQHPSLRKARATRLKSSTGFSAGRAAGARADIGQGRVSNRGRAALV